MGRVLAVDYGEKRCGLAWTDPLRLIATALPPCLNEGLLAEIQRIIATEPIDCIALGFPTNFRGEDTHATAGVKIFAEKLNALYPDLPIHFVDERLTSKLAAQSMINMGANKQTRRDKLVINSVSATLILQDFLARNS